MDPWGGQHQCQCPLELLVSSYEFKAALAKENREVKGDIALIDKLIIKANTDPKFDWNKSTYPAFEARRDLHPKVIVYFLAGLESHGHGPNSFAENEPEIYDWYDRLLDCPLPVSLKLPALTGYMLYFDADFGLGEFDPDKEEKILNLREQLADIQPSYSNYIKAANTARRLKKWTEVIEYCKKGFKYYAKDKDMPVIDPRFLPSNRTNDPDVIARYLGLPGSGGESFAIYEKIIEAQVESKNFEDAMKTFKKIKKFNLNSMDADNVDYDTPKNKAIQLSNFDENNVYSTLKFRSETFRKMQAMVYSFKDAQKAVFILGSLCLWKSEIFKFLGDLKEQCKWLKLACEIYNFFWIDLSTFILKGPAALGIDESEDLIEKTIYTACTIYSYEIKLQTQAGIQMKEGCIPMQHLLKRLKPTIDALTEHGKDKKAYDYKFEIVKLLPKTVERFSIPADNCRLCLDALILMFDSKSQLTFGENKELEEQLVTYRNSLPVEKNSEQAESKKIRPTSEK